MENDETNELDEEELAEMEYNKKSIITFSKLNKYFLIPFLCPIIYVISILFGVLIEKTDAIKMLHFLQAISNDLSYIFAGLFYLIPYFKVNVNKKNESSSNNSGNSGIIYIYNEGIIDNYNPCKIMMLIILLSIIIVIIDILNIYIDIINDNYFVENIYYLIFIPLFSKIILKEDIYKHQYFSLIIAIFGSIFLCIPVCLKIRSQDIIPIIYVFICGIIYPLFLVIIKYISEKYYISPLKISFLIGIIALILECIWYIIYSLIEYNDLSYFNEIFDFSKGQNKFLFSIYIILHLLFKLLQQLFILLALFYFSPTLIIITDIINPFLFWIIKIIFNYISLSKDDLIDIVLNPLGYVIALFSALVYNEIIIFNFCGLNKNTKKFVNVRQNEELKDIKKTQDALLSDYNDSTLNND